MLRHDLTWHKELTKLVPYDELRSHFYFLNKCERLKPGAAHVFKHLFKGADKQCANDVVHAAPGYMFEWFSTDCLGKPGCFASIKGRQAYDYGHACQPWVIKSVGDKKLVRFITDFRPRFKIRDVRGGGAKNPTKHTVLDNPAADIDRRALAAAGGVQQRRRPDVEFDLEWSP